MLPTLFSIGNFTLSTLGFLLGIGFFFFSFLLWRRLKDLGLIEERIIDLTLSLGFWGLIFSRLFYILANFSQFGFSSGHWLLIGRYPGLSFWGWLFALLPVLAYYCRKEKWSFWKVADEVSFAILPFLMFFQAGCFFDGSQLGRPTAGLLGMYFPGSLVKRFPLSLFWLGLLFGLWFFLLWLEREWQMFSWYKSKADGLISLLLLGLLSLLNLILVFTKETGLYFFYLEIGLSLALLITAVLFIIKRSGRKIWLK